MSQEVTNIKKRIKSVTGAYKVTSAMKLVSSVRLNASRNKMLNNRTYLNEVSMVMETLFHDAKKETSPFVISNASSRRLFVIVSSTLGLCGAYNQNIFKVTDNVVTDEDEVIILGKKGITHYQNNNFAKLEGFESYNSIKDENTIKDLVDYLIKEYIGFTYGEIHFIYTKYVNPLIFKAEDEIILPIVNKDNENKEGPYPPVFEPSRAALIDAIAPFYIKSKVFSHLLESEVSEQASRSNAMDNATKNAEELLDNLKIEFNKARQNAITQEIIEITSASKN